METGTGDKNTDGTFFPDKYVKFIYKGMEVFTIGQMADGSFFLRPEKAPSGSEAATGLVLAEDRFVSMIASALMYCEHHNIDLSKKISELTKNETIGYICPVQTGTAF